MSHVFNLGSINIDHVYQMPRLARPGETISSFGYARGAGGKGFNQSVALARAAARVNHIGFIGEDGAWLRDFLSAEGVDCTGVFVTDDATGHAIILRRSFAAVARARRWRQPAVLHPSPYRARARLHQSRSSAR